MRFPKKRREKKELGQEKGKSEKKTREKGSGRFQREKKTLKRVPSRIKCQLRKVRTGTPPKNQAVSSTGEEPRKKASQMQTRYRGSRGTQEKKKKKRLPDCFPSARESGKLGGETSSLCCNLFGKNLWESKLLRES